MFLSATWGKRRRNCILTLTHSLRLVSLFRCKFNATQLLLLVFYLAYFWILLMYSILPEKGCSCIECLMLLSSFFPMGIWQYFALLQGMLLFIYFFLSSEHSTIWKSSMVMLHPLNSHLTPSCSDQWTCNWRHRQSSNRLGTAYSTEKRVFSAGRKHCIAESLDMAISSIRCGELPIDRSLPCHKTQLANVACPLLLSSVIEVSPWCKQCRFSELSILLARRGIGSRRLSDYEFIW